VQALGGQAWGEGASSAGQCQWEPQQHWQGYVPLSPTPLAAGHWQGGGEGVQGAMLGCR
jgi:hypothetical protein